MMLPRTCVVTPAGSDAKWPMPIPECRRSGAVHALRVVVAKDTPRGTWEPVQVVGRGSKKERGANGGQAGCWLPPCARGCGRAGGDCSRGHAVDRARAPRGRR